MRTLGSIVRLCILNSSLNHDSEHFIPCLLWIIPGDISECLITLHHDDWFIYGSLNISRVILKRELKPWNKWKINVPLETVPVQMRLLRPNCFGTKKIVPPAKKGPKKTAPISYHLNVNKIVLDVFCRKCSNLMWSETCKRSSLKWSSFIEKIVCAIIDFESKCCGVIWFDILVVGLNLVRCSTTCASNSTYFEKVQFWKKLVVFHLNSDRNKNPMYFLKTRDVRTVESCQDQTTFNSRIPERFIDHKLCRECRKC